MRLFAAMLVVVVLGAGAGVGGYYVQEWALSFDTSPEPDWSAEGRRQRVMRGLRAQIANPTGNKGISVEELKAKLVELEKTKARSGN